MTGEEERRLAYRAGGTTTQSVLRPFSVPQTLWACFSSSGPAWTRYHTPLSPRSTRTACMRRLAMTSPCALCRRAQVDLATSSFLTEATCTRQPPVGPDILSIRLAMLGPVSVVPGLTSVVAGVVGVAGVVAPASGGVGPLPAGAAGVTGCSGVGVLEASASGGLGAAGAGRPLAGSLGLVEAGSSFSGWIGTAPGAMRL